MDKKKAPFPRPLTHFELVPVEVVVKIATLDTPFEVTAAREEPDVHSSPPETQPRTKK